MMQASQGESEGSSAASRRKRTSRIALSDDEDDVDFESGSTPRKGNHPNGKRRRSAAPQRNGSGDGASDNDDEALTDLDEDEDGDEAGAGAADEGRAAAVADAAGSFKPEYQRGSDGYVAGSVVRLKLVNFMTYNYVEFRPGPHLNMILGPNGTGKSTIAAGIAIGLGFHPRLMGRDTNLRSYVKHGRNDEAEIEVELKGFPGKRNTIVSRKFSRDDEKSEFKLDNQPATKKAVTDIVRSYGVQPNNLCCFLPQDKVSEFAKMTPDLVLRETMRAAGDERLTGWYQQLCEKDTKRKAVEQTLEAETAELKKVTDQAEGLEGDVRLYQDKRDKEEKREVLIMETHLARLHERQAEKRKILGERDQIQQVIHEMEERDKPLQALKRKYAHLSEKSRNSLTVVGDSRREAMREWTKGLDKVQAAIDQQETFDRELKSLRQVAERRLKEKKNLEDKIANARRILEEPQEEVQGQIDAMNKQLRGANAKYRAVREESKALVDQRYANEREMNSIRVGLDQKLKALERLQNVSTQREVQAGDFDPCIAWLIRWLERHNDQLQGAWHKPPMISVDVPDKRYAAQVESCTSVAIRKTFIFESKADYDMIVQRLQGQKPPEDAIHHFTTVNRPSFEIKRLMFHMTYLEVTDRNVNPPRICSPEELNRLGLDGWAIDFVDAKPAVIAFLNERGGLSSAAVTLSDGRGIRDDEMSKLGISRWATRNEITNASRSSYGSRSVFSSTRPVDASKAFGLVSDQSGIARITEEMATMKNRLREMEGPVAEGLRLEKEKREEGEKMQQLVAKLTSEMEKLQEKRVRHSRAMVEIADCEAKLAANAKQPSTDERRQRLRAEKLRTLRDSMPRVRAFENIVVKLSDVSKASCELSLRKCQIDTDRQVIEDRVAYMGQEHHQIIEARMEIERQLKEVNEACRQLKATVTTASIAAESIVPDIRERSLARFSSDGPHPTLREIQQELDAVTAELALAHGIDESTVQRHRRLELQRKDLERTVAAHRNDMDTIKKSIRRIENFFLPGLDALIGAVSKKFSAAFQRLGCAGDVQVARSEEGYDKWGIHILVSYRDTEPLQILTGTTQSGGERSLATVTYLMSLSEMARTPFSLVDEINQGMDQKAERAVHNQLVETTCGADTGQYFLITPKLLTNLHYHRRMKVLVVNSGQHLPDTRKKGQQWGELASCLKRYEVRHAGTAR